MSDDARERERDSVLALLRGVYRGRVEWLEKNLPEVLPERDGISLTVRMIIREIEKGAHRQ